MTPTRSALLAAALVIAASASSRPEPKPGAYAPVHGLRMYYEVHGKGEPLLILHGGTGTLEFWPQALQYFSKYFRVIAPEQMGHGRTNDDPKRPFSYHGMAEDTFALMQYLKIPHAYVLGWSDGGIVGLDLASNHPEAVTRLVVMGTNFLPTPKAVDPHAAEWLTRAKARCGPGDNEQKGDCWPKELREVYERLSPDGAAHWPIVYERLHKMWMNEPNFSREQLKKITAATFVIAGDDDMVLPHHTVDLYQSIPGARLWMAPNAGHMLPIRRPDEFNGAVLKFLQEPPPAKHE